MRRKAGPGVRILSGPGTPNMTILEKNFVKWMRRLSNAAVETLLGLSRHPLKRPRDADHARVVEALVRTYLRLPFTAKEMPWLPPELKALLKELKRR